MARTFVSASPRTAAVFDAASAEDAGKLLLRATLGLLMLLHGIGKIRSGPGAVAEMLVQHGLPGALAYGAYIGEVLAPALVIAGLWTRPAALLMAVNMIAAIALAHGEQIFALGKEGGWAIELQGLYLFGAIAIALLGAGGLGVGGARGRWN